MTRRPAATPVRRWAATWAPAAVATALAVLILAPALGRGYLLTYDMVWVPDLGWRADLLGSGPALPRAVPSDGVVALVDEVVPGMLLQKLVLLTALVLAGTGAARLAGSSPVARAAAAAVAVWNPFVVERLWMGHWTLLLGYGALPWLAHLALRARREAAVPAALPLLVAVGSLSANAGLASAVTVLVLGTRWRGLRARRTTAFLAAAALAAQAPWVVAGLLHRAAAHTTGTALFGLGGDGLPAPLAALTLGGIWNRDVVPGSRAGSALPLLATALLAAAVVLGGPRAWRRLGRRSAAGLAALWVLGYAVALLTWLAPGLLDDLAAQVPGSGLLRDGSRWLALCLPALAAVVGDAAAAAADRVGAGDRWAAAALAALLPVALLPDAVAGVGGRLTPATYPADWPAAARAVARAATPGDVLLVPLGAYRAPRWNHGRTVLDPLGRYLPRPTVTDDRLPVSGRLLPGEDPRVPLVARALALPTPQARSARLRELGIGLVATERDAAGAADVPDLEGRLLLAGPTLTVRELGGGAGATVQPRVAPAGWRLPLLAAWTAYAAVVAATILLPVLRVGRSRLSRLSRLFRLFRLFRARRGPRRPPGACRDGRVPAHGERKEEGCANR